MTPTDFEEKKKAMRATRTVRALTPDERQQQEDIRWALDDPEVRMQYQGEFVVPFQRRILAHGHNPDLLLQEAERKLGGKLSGLPMVAIVPPLEEIPLDGAAF